MLRVKNEEQWIGPCIESIIDWFDEVVVCMQNCTDDTESIVRAFDNEKISIYQYPHDSWPNGEGYAQQNPHNVKSRTYFYNWCLAKTSMTHVCKWDGDMVAMDWIGDSVHALLRKGIDTININGVDIVGPELRHVGARKRCAMEPRIFKAHSFTRYENGSLCEKLSGIAGREFTINRPAFLHFKWAKSIETATQAWPDDWEQLAHFQNIIKRATPVAEYEGEYPRVMRHA
jgi:glycosyltransferase involved in cell wall biosynthesis